MKDTEQLLYAYIAASSEARTFLSRLKGCEIEDIDVQTALMEVLNLTEPTDLLFKELGQKEMVRLLRGFDFDRLHPEVLAQIELDESAIPEGVPRLLTEITVRNKGEQWRIHKNDADPFPSNPHAVCLGDGMKLDLSTGQLYRKRQCLGQIKEKHLLAIRQKAEAKGVVMPELKQ